MSFKSCYTSNINMEKIKNLNEFKTRMLSDTALVERMKEDPIKTANEVLDPASDPKIFKIVLYFVGTSLIFSLVVASVVALSPPIQLTTPDGTTYNEVRKVDQFFVMIGSAAIGALAGLLVPRPE